MLSELAEIEKLEAEALAAAMPAAPTAALESGTALMLLNASLLGGKTNLKHLFTAADISVDVTAATTEESTKSKTRVKNKKEAVAILG